MDRIPASKSKSRLEVSGIIPVEQMAGEDEEDSALLREMEDNAEKFLKFFPWCLEIQESFFGAGIGGIVAIFFFRIAPSRPDVDEWLWVVVGDMPPAYLVIDRCKTPSEAIEAYIEEMSEWVELARHGQESADVIPVNVPNTPEWAENLSSRLKTLKTILLPQINLRIDERAKS